MRQTYLEAYKDIDHLNTHKQILQSASTTAQQSFLQVLINLSLYNNREPIENIQTLLTNYKGSFSHQILLLKYCTYCMEKDKTKIHNMFIILKLLTKWVDVFEQAKKKKDVRLYEAIVDHLELGCCTYEEFIVYLNFISNDVLNLIKSGTEESKKKYGDLSKSPHLDANDLIKLLNVILPKVLTNMMIPRNFFPPTLLKSTAAQVDILYSFQTVQNIAQNKSHYNILVRTIIKTLISFQLEPSQLKQVVLSSFKYYYLYHHEKSYAASQLVIQCFKKMTSAVRFAILDQILLFFIVLRKLGKELFISYLGEKFGWVADAIKNNTNVIGMNKGMFKPFFNMTFGNSLKIKVDAGKIQHYYMEIYDCFSLVYFCLRCLQHNITVRLYYMGKFDVQEGKEEKKLLVCSEKKQGTFQGSIETIEEGIYMFQFDNSYAWMKAKNIAFDLSILVPIQIREHNKNKIKPMIFEKSEHLNQVPYQNVVGWIDENEIKVNSTSVNVSLTAQGNVKIYNIKLIKNTGQAYEYQTESKNRFLKKIHAIEKDPNLFWLIDGYKVRGVNQIQKWLDGQFQPQRLHISHEKDHDRQQSVQDEAHDEIQQMHEQQSQAQLVVEKQQQKQVEEKVKTEKDAQEIDRKQISTENEKKQQPHQTEVVETKVQISSSPESQKQQQKKESNTEKSQS